MREAHLREQQMGREGKFVEADETYVGGKGKNRAYAKTLAPKEAVMSLVERGGKDAGQPAGPLVWESGSLKIPTTDSRILDFPTGRT
jgi:hypothetical protein